MDIAMNRRTFVGGAVAAGVAAATVKAAPLAQADENVVDADIAIVGGGMSRMGDRLLQYTREILDTHALRIPYGCCTIVTAVLGDAAGMLGAAVYAKEQFRLSAANNGQN